MFPKFPVRGLGLNEEGAIEHNDNRSSFMQGESLDLREWSRRTPDCQERRSPLLVSAFERLMSNSKVVCLLLPTQQWSSILGELGHAYLSYSLEWNTTICPDSLSEGNKSEVDWQHCET